jgi:hypothetical protein
MAEKVHLQILLSLKFTFDNFLSYKINFQQNQISFDKCLQNIIHAKFNMIIVTILCT